MMVKMMMLMRTMRMMMRMWMTTMLFQRSDQLRQVRSISQFPYCVVQRLLVVVPWVFPLYAEVNARVGCTGVQALSLPPAPSSRSDSNDNKKQQLLLASVRFAQMGRTPATPVLASLSFDFISLLISSNSYRSFLLSTSWFICPLFVP